MTAHAAIEPNINNKIKLSSDVCRHGIPAAEIHFSYCEIDKNREIAMIEEMGLLTEQLRGTSLRKTASGEGGSLSARLGYELALRLQS